MFAGAYTNSSGIELIRQDVAKYIERRDGYPCNASDISLTGGASEGVKVILHSQFLNISNLTMAC